MCSVLRICRWEGKSINESVKDSKSIGEEAVYGFVL